MYDCYWLSNALRLEKYVWPFCCSHFPDAKNRLYCGCDMSLIYMFTIICASVFEDREVVKVISKFYKTLPIISVVVNGHKSFFSFFFGHTYTGKVLMATFYWWRKTSGAASVHHFRYKWADLSSFLTWKNPVSLAGFEPTGLRGKCQQR